MPIPNAPGPNSTPTETRPLPATPGSRRHAWQVLLPVLAVLYSLGFLNLFLRSSIGVMGPDLTREMALTPAMLSAVGSSFFFAYALMQIPTGMLLDRFGARRTLATMLLFTTAGAGLFSIGTTPLVLGLGRVLMGIGCAGVFTGAFFVLARWFTPERVVPQVATLNSISSFGGLCAATPLAALIATIGWRPSYWIFTAVVALVMVAAALVIRDDPPGHAPPQRPKETLAQAIAGVREAIRQPGMRRLAFVGLPISAGSTLTGLWGAPYLKDVQGLDEIARGNVLLVMSAGGMLGHFLYGQAARALDSIKRPILMGGTIVASCSAAMALMERPPLLLVTVLFAATALCSSYPSLSHAHARSLVPPHLIGRGVAAINMGGMTAIAAIQLAFGWVVGLFPQTAGVSPEIAFRSGFALLACAALIALVIYATTPDARLRAP